MIKTISHDDFLALEGLLLLAKEHVRNLQDIEHGIAALVKVTDEDGDKSGIGDPQHIGDACYTGYSGYSASKLLAKLGIKREAAQQKAKAPGVTR